MIDGIIQKHNVLSKSNGFWLLNILNLLIYMFGVPFPNWTLVMSHNSVHYLEFTQIESQSDDMELLAVVGL